MNVKNVDSLKVYGSDLHLQVFLQEKDYYIKNVCHKQWEILKVQTLTVAFSCILMSTYIYVSFLLPKVDQFDEKLYVYEDCTMIFV